ncbi:hypothetical protein EX895_002450 [Sporisorium graminicola]|uniref:MFS-type efflux pump MMF1 n=1 Tax=Sporisorium graminicola TaxID=280036 RepID=A0A4U7KZX5_9BASI|nr:hypothetical protein EX895_002450 [Sporisorium graminicola]TKY88462.1 hypothetical protein EX895_002450 [Sporisorium graminicola]
MDGNTDTSSVELKLSSKQNVLGTATSPSAEKRPFRVQHHHQSRAPFAPVDTAGQYSHSSAATASDLPSGFYPSCTLNRHKNSKVHQAYPERRPFCIRGPFNWISFSNLDPFQDLTTPRTIPPPPAAHSLGHQRRSKLAGPKRIDFAPQNNTMTDNKRASIEAPGTPWSYATPVTPELADQVDTTASTPTLPHFLQSQKFEESNDTSASFTHAHESEPQPGPTQAEAPSGGEQEGHTVKKDLRFWMIFGALLLISLIAALDMTMISTALPAIAADLPASSIAANWVTSAFLLPMTASQPIFGGLSCSIGRKWAMNSALIIFLVGSVVCATAKTFLVLVVGRGIQGLGGGGIHSCCEIIMSDLTTLRERGLFFGMIAVVFALAGFTAPVLGGVFSEHSWPWIFWINLPLGAAALVILFLFLDIRVPLLTGREKWQKLDLVGNAVLFGSVTSILIAVTEGGVKYHWSSPRVWVPLLVGVLGMGLFCAIEWVPNRLSRKPVFPLELFSNRTSAFAYLQTFVHGLIYYGVIYMIPIYFQSIKDRTPLQSAVWTFPLNAPSFPLAMIAGAAISLTGKFKALIFIGWIFVAAGVGWMTRWDVGTSKAEWAISQMIGGAGLGILFPITLPPIQAALPASRLESATAAYAFTRTFGAVWGITAATTIFSTQAVKGLRPYYAQLNPLGLNDFTVVAYSESLRHLPQPLQHLVKGIYSKAISDSFWLFVPLAIIGFFTTFAIKELPLPDFIKSEAKLEQKEDAIPALAHGAETAAVGFKAEVPSTMP